VRQKLVVDVDTGIDDSLALVYLVAHPQAELLGVVSTAGNVPAAQVAANNLAWLDLCGRADIEVARGAEAPLAVPLRTCEETHGPKGTGYAELPASTRPLSQRSGAQMWVDAARQAPGAVVGLVTGPMTTLAQALEIEPQLPQLLHRLVVMGGTFNHPGNTTPVAEWNMWVDPEAAKIVFDAFAAAPADRRPLVCGLDVTERIAMTPEHVRRLGELSASVPPEIIAPHDPLGERSTASNPLVRHLSDAIRFYLEFHRASDEGFIAHMHDPLAAAVALNPQWVKTRPATVDVELSGTLTRGATVADWAGLWGRQPNADVATDTAPEAFFEHLLATVGAFARGLASGTGAVAVSPV
jgi:purine nucleosidase